MNFGEFNVAVCSGAHGEAARKNYEEKKKLGIKPGMPAARASLPPIEEENE